ncbi:hypothetical protein Pmani_034060 [Petrolisthes manimaculis]|uniref:Uncharacterized protein n=1 Tax=Petrolisthes manimaculis TaxID=1843537 RepID=A0AAE1NQ64_9EUCA|nr:hypothetical protein Pmani_034060 [Petrolisthes manimaculis]
MNRDQGGRLGLINNRTGLGLIKWIYLPAFIISPFTHTMTLYDVLGVSQDASETEIRRQYQELARQFHPDKSDTDSAKEKFLKVTEAWHILGDTQKRREYDDQLKREKLYQEFPVSEELFLEDLERDREGGVYLHSCRCGGRYSLAAQDARNSTEKEVVVVCDSCSLSILVLLNCDDNT